jgi:hypothetical protein
MTPDEIKRFIQENYQDIYCKKRKRGWSFWYREPISRPGYSTRIARAVLSRDGSTRFKLSVTSILTDKDDVYSITSKEELRRLFDQELRLWKQNYRAPAGTQQI